MSFELKTKIKIVIKTMLLNMIHYVLFTYQHLQLKHDRFFNYIL